MSLIFMDHSLFFRIVIEKRLLTIRAECVKDVYRKFFITCQAFKMFFHFLLSFVSSLYHNQSSHKNKSALVISSISVMNDIRVSQLVIAKTNFGINFILCRVRSPNGPFGKRTLHLNRLGRGDFSHISLREIYPARPSLLTVFSITQSDHLIMLLSIHDITDSEILTRPL